MVLSGLRQTSVAQWFIQRRKHIRTTLHFAHAGLFNALFSSLRLCGTSRNNKGTKTRWNKYLRMKLSPYDITKA